MLVCADLDGDGVVRVSHLFGDETSYKKFTGQPAFRWVAGDAGWSP